MSLDSSLPNQPGICYLAGAGPGDLGLVTLKTKDCVEQADVIVYDYLCNPEILKWARPGVELIPVGKKCGDHTCTQAQINVILVEKTAAGNKVVRLKGGDPFLFGRGGEEAEALVNAGLQFEVIPGVSSAIAVPAYAGIPITHRECASQVTIFTGHEDPTKPRSGLDLDKLAKEPGTKVLLMGIKRLGMISEELIKRGADPATPVALVRWGTTSRQQTLSGPLGEIARLVEESQFTSPAVVVIGEVVNLQKKLGWFKPAPKLA